MALHDKVCANLKVVSPKDRVSTTPNREILATRPAIREGASWQLPSAFSKTFSCKVQKQVTIIFPARRTVQQQFTIILPTRKYQVVTALPALMVRPHDQNTFDPNERGLEVVADQAA